MVNEINPASQPPITREKLLLYRAGALSSQEQEDIRRALAADPRLAACCHEEECLDDCIERCCKEEKASGDLQSRIRACLEASALEAATAHAAASPPVPVTAAAAAAPAPAVASAKLLHLPSDQATPARAAARGMGRIAMATAAALLLVVGAVWIASYRSPSRLALGPVSPPAHPQPLPHAPHGADNPLDAFIAEFEPHPHEALPAESQVISYVNKVGLQRPPHGPSVMKLVSVRDVDCPCGSPHPVGVKVCFQCPGKISWNLSVLCVSPDLLKALHEHDSIQSKLTHRTYFYCGDKTGKHPCAVFWESDGKIMVLVAEQPTQNLVAMADGLEF